MTGLVNPWELAVKLIRADLQDLAVMTADEPSRQVLWEAIRAVESRRSSAARLTSGRQVLHDFAGCDANGLRGDLTHDKALHVAQDALHEVARLLALLAIADAEQRRERANELVTQAANISSTRHTDRHQGVVEALEELYDVAALFLTERGVGDE